MTRSSLVARTAALACSCAMLLAFQGNAQAQAESGSTYSGTFPINGAQQVPPNGSPASGTGMVTLDTLANQLSWNISYANLTGPVTAAHFHGPAPAGLNAGVQVGLGVSNPNMGSTAVTAQQASDIIAGLWYVNIHSTMFPGGEIRGQVLVSPVGPAVPTMGEWGLATLAVLLLGAGVAIVRRRTALSGT